MDALTRSIKIHQPEDFAAMRRAGRLAAEVLDFITPHVAPGISTLELDRLCHDFIVGQGGIPALLGYKGYPNTICASVNHVVCHGIPNDKPLRDGDIVNLDVTVLLDGWHGDTSRMYPVGRISRKAARLIETTHAAMMAGIALVRPGATIGDIGHAIESLAWKARYASVRDFSGHGLGRLLHDAPTVTHFGNPGEGEVLREGMFLTIEPMLNVGDWRVKLKPDGWTAVTRDLSLSAQFEHSIGVTADGHEIFTLSPKGWHCPPYGE